jgi:hypothetical protein
LLDIFWSSLQRIAARLGPDAIDGGAGRLGCRVAMARTVEHAGTPDS